MEKNHLWHLLTIGLIALFASAFFTIYYVPSVRQLVIDILIDREAQEAGVIKSVTK